MRNQLKILLTVLSGIFAVVIDKTHNGDEKIEIIKGVYEIIGITEKTVKSKVEIKKAEVK